MGSYSIVGSDGGKYGPADLETLMQWAKEGRLTPEMTVEDAATGATGTAQAMLGPLGAFGPPPSAVPPAGQPAPPAPSQPYG